MNHYPFSSLSSLQEAYMDHIFQPGRFSLHSIARALNVSYLNKYTAKLLFHQSPARHSDYTVTTTVTM